MEYCPAGARLSWSMSCEWRTLYCKVLLYSAHVTLGIPIRHEGKESLDEDVGNRKITFCFQSRLEKQ